MAHDPVYQRAGGSNADGDIGGGGLPIHQGRKTGESLPPPLKTAEAVGGENSPFHIDSRPDRHRQIQMLKSRFESTIGYLPTG
jgi:hypothetical protein